MDVKITPQEIVKPNELQLNILKAFEFTSYVIGCHVYKDRWTRVKSEMLNSVVEPKNKEYKFAVAVRKDDCLVEHLPKEKTGKLAKLIFYFLQACDLNTCSVEITGKAINEGDGKGMKVTCKLYFSAENSFIHILKQELPKTL